MKKEGYCDKCDLKFTYEIKNMNDTKNVKCPKCNSDVTGKTAPIKVTKIEKAVGNTANVLIDIYFYFYLIFSIIGLITYYIGLNKLFIVSFIIMMILYVIELLLGYTRNIFGTLGIIIGGIIGYIFLNNIPLGITYVFLISGIIKLIINFILNVIIRKCS